MNPILLCDGYKLDHRRQYPKGTTGVYSNFTPRGSRVPGVNKVVFFGLQYFLIKYLGEEFNQHFFDQPRHVVATRYRNRVDSYLGPNSIGVNHILALYDLGYLPLDFRALPEGTHVPLRIPMFTVENTHPDFFWLVNYIETLISNILWLPCTSATTAYRFRYLLDGAAAATGGDPAFVGWQGHDFSFRGMAGIEAAALSGAGHLLSFDGTDTIPAIDLLQQYYGKAVGGSVAATEHSVMCAGGEDDELTTISNLLDLYPTGILSVVSDTWDLWNVVYNILPQLQDKIMARNGKLVIRPDSGNPADILCGDPLSKDPRAALGLIRSLARTFGATRNDKGYYELNSHIGAIYGDSITYERAREIVTRLEGLGYASTNVVLGIGSYTYQHVTRDTFGFAMKATWVEINGEGRSIYKTPKTDSGEKFSARGRLMVEKLPSGSLNLVEDAEPEDEARSLLRPVWRNGTLLEYNRLDEIRQRVFEG